ncbi:MAG: hypothetical protein FWC78_08720, partial [Defluviitaleaceae bacterium]|nr:hypothetical protein [Defluviitaleaceae bacterium]
SVFGIVSNHICWRNMAYDTDLSAPFGSLFLSLGYSVFKGQFCGEKTFELRCFLFPLVCPFLGRRVLV